MALEKLRARAERNALSRSHNLIQLGLSCMSFSTIIFSAVQVWQLQHKGRFTARELSMSSGNPTLDSINQNGDHIVWDQAQLRLLLDSISKISSQIATLNDQLDLRCGDVGSRPIGTHEGQSQKHFPGRGLHQSSSMWIWIFSIAAFSLWVLGAVISICGLRQFSVKDVSRILTWGLGAGSFGLSMALFWKNVDNAWLYVVVTVTPAYVAMNIALSFVGGEVEEKKG